jgi:hypothetical protein
MTVCVSVFYVDLRRGYEAPFLVRPGRLPLLQGLSERRVVYRDRSPVVTGPRDPSQNVHACNACRQQANKAVRKGHSMRGIRWGG